MKLKNHQIKIDSDHDWLIGYKKGAVVGKDIL
jgi:hypothetical protein